jgi:hypothetical protein
MSADTPDHDHPLPCTAQPTGVAIPTPAQIDDLEPCAQCFPDGEVDLPREDLRVGSREPTRLHRHNRTGPVDMGRDGRRTLAERVRDFGPAAIEEVED